MLDFLRKYQKALFIVVTAMVVASFVFFGTFSTFVDDTRAPQDRVIGQAVDGSEVHLLEMQALSRFLSVEGEVVRADLLRTQIADELVRREFDLVKGSLESKVQRVKAYRAYQHPQAPFLSAKAVWEHVAPQINREWSALQVTEEVTPEAFTHLARLCQLQGALPQDVVRRVLLTQEQRCNWLAPDPRLRHEDLALFGFHSLTDWFGSEFVELMAEFIHNAAVLAEQQGFSVSMQEAKSDWLQTHSRDALRAIGLNENDAVAVWRKVLLFRRSFQELGKATFVDRLAYAEFTKVADEQALVDLYRWGDALPVKSAVDALAFNLYAKAVLPRGELEAPPSALASIDEVASRSPLLVAARYTAKITAVDKREAALRAPLKDLWDFETKPTTWTLLTKEFPALQKFRTVSEEDRFQALEQLEAKLRTSVDLFARRKLVEEHPEWIRDALSAAKPEEKELVLSGGEIALPHLRDSKRLAQLFEEILTAPETSLAELQFFATPDAVFRFENIAKISGPAIKTFAVARQDGSLDRLVDEKLEKEYAKLPADKKAKPLAEMREEIAARVLKKSPQERLVKLAERAKTDLAAWTRGEGEDPLLAQFKLERLEQKVPRASGESEAFKIAPQEWSSVHPLSDGSIGFFFLKERTKAADSVAEPVALGQQILGAEVQRTAALKLIDQMVEHKAVIIPFVKE